MIHRIDLTKFDFSSDPLYPWYFYGIRKVWSHEIDSATSKAFARSHLIVFRTMHLEKPKPSITNFRNCRNIFYPQSHQRIPRSDVFPVNWDGRPPQDTLARKNHAAEDLGDFNQSYRRQFAEANSFRQTNFLSIHSCYSKIFWVLKFLATSTNESLVSLFIHSCLAKW